MVKTEGMQRVNGIEPLGKGTFYQYLGSSVQTLSGVVFYIFLTHIYSTASVGAISLFLATIGMMSIAFSFGLEDAAKHFISYYIGFNDRDALWSVTRRLLKFGVILSLFSALSLYLLSPFISQILFHSLHYSNFLRFLGPVLAVNILFRILNGLLLGHQGFKVSGQVVVIRSLFYYFSGLLLSLIYTSLLSIIVGWFLGITIGCILEFYILLKAKSFAKPILKKHQNDRIFSYSAPLVFSSFIIFGANYSDRFIVSGLSGLAQLGVYNIALVIATSLGFVLGPLGNITITKFSELYASGKITSINYHFRLLSLLLYSIVAPLGLGIASVSNLIIKVLVGNHYLEGNTALDIVAIGFSLFVGGNLILQSLSAIRRTSISITSSIVGLTSNIIISVILIPLIGIRGAAFGYVSIYATSFFILYIYAKRFGIIQFATSGMLRIWGVSAIMFIILHYLVDLTGSNLLLFPIYVAIGAFIYIMLFKRLKILSKEDSKVLISLFSGRLKFANIIISFLAS